jgi:D-glycero-D-manno-heptose 1,7-bisphosphate phosphatase
MDKAIFLDRDGTIIEEKGFICLFSDVEIFSFSAEAIKKMNQHNYRVFVVTNQSAVARGICTEEQIIEVHSGIKNFFLKQDAIIDKFYYSPYLEEGIIPEYKKNDVSRKPSPGMILQAADAFNIDLKKSFMIGDSSRDIVAGKNAGCQTILVLTGNGRLAQKELKALNLVPDYIAENILEAVQFIVE